MYRWSPGPVLGGKIKMVRDPNGDFVLFDELPREQRRYEIARLRKAIAYGIGRGMVTIPFYDHEIEYSRSPKNVDEFVAEAIRLAGGD